MRIFESVSFPGCGH